MTPARCGSTSDAVPGAPVSHQAPVRPSCTSAPSAIAHHVVGHEAQSPERGDAGTEGSHSAPASYEMNPIAPEQKGRWSPDATVPPDHDVPSALRRALSRDSRVAPPPGAGHATTREGRAITDQRASGPSPAEMSAHASSDSGHAASTCDGLSRHGSRRASAGAGKVARAACTDVVCTRSMVGRADTMCRPLRRESATLRAPRRTAHPREHRCLQPPSPPPEPHAASQARRAHRRRRSPPRDGRVAHARSHPAHPRPDHPAAPRAQGE